MAAQEVLDYYVKKEWSGAIPYAVQSYVIRRNILLQQITILPQIPDTLIHGIYLKGFI